MSLRKKTLLIIAATVLLLMMTLYLLSRSIVSGSFIALETRYAHEEVGRVIRALDDVLTQLLATNGDWSAWDDTCAFLEGTNPEYIVDNMMNATFVNLRLHLMVFVDNSGRVVYEKTVNLETGQEMPMIPSLAQYLAPQSRLVRHATPDSALSGVLMLPEGALLVASRPIVDSEKHGPIRGALIIGRFLDASEIERLAALVHLPVQAYPLHLSKIPVEIEEVRALISKDQPFVVKLLSADSLAGYGLVQDIHGQPGLILRVKLFRDIYQQGEKSIRYFLTFLFAACAILGLVILLLLERIVLSRLAEFYRGVNRIRGANDLSLRLETSGRDEIAALAHAMNDMLTALETSQMLLRKLEKAVETTEVGITITDIDGRIVYVNPADAKMHGYRVDELFGQYANIFAPSAPSTPSEDLPKRHEDFAYWQRERVNIRKDGTEFPVSLISNPITDAHGRPLGKVIVCEDITDRKRAEAELLAAHNELKEKNAQLAELNASKDKFFSIIAHDLRGPFASLISLSEVVLLFLDEYSKEDIRKNMLRIKTSSEAVSALLENLLTWSRLQRGVMKYAPEIMKIRNIVEENIELFSSQSEQKQIALHCLVPPELTAYADFHICTAIIRNLLSNALKFTPAGGRIVVSATQHHAEIVVSVADTGTGISAEDLHKLFRIDVQFTNIGTNGEHGTGLGLKLCKDLVEAQKGRIWVESELGKGTTFRFTLPCHADASEK
ncbi:putative Histidine kinase [Candidatus Moduliflexus flocculans]|uniref:histidine kinase n=1 Tax=Candidatus Moduliflexus flocculans TaxID=1499966 RepID=A0A081BQV6_9BACT|nr:putative Histidine kinase [Candidatus Moduliflexus flocculans]